MPSRLPNPRRGRRGAEEPPSSGAAAVDAEPDAVSVARAIALRQLTAAPRSRAELERAMERRDVPPEAAAQVLDRFTEVGLVDDAAYARVVVRSKHTGRGLARRALAQELRTKGIEPEVAQDALAELDSAEERRTAQALVTRKLRSMGDLDPQVQRRRLAGMLARKGYPAGLAFEIVTEALTAPVVTEADVAEDL